MYEELKNINILYVEDDDFIREQTSSLLSVIFNNVYTANDGQDGIEKFESYEDELHAVITDINMPKVSGIDMSKKIKSMNNSDIPIIAVSAYSEDDHAVQDITDIFTNYLRKPIQIKDLINSIDEAIKSTQDK